MSTLTPELQTRADLKNAREQTTMDVGLVRDFAHGEFPSLWIWSN